MVETVMPQINFSETLPYSARDLYDLVMDIGRYPDIFEDIKAVRVRKIGDERCEADVTISTPLKTMSYSCIVEGSPPERIDIRATQGVFKSMQAQWTFTPQPDGRTRVGYRMEFDFGGMGFMNAAALGFMQDAVDKTRAHLKEYAAQKLTQVASKAPAPRPGGY